MASFNFGVDTVLYPTISSSETSKYLQISINLSNEGFEDALSIFIDIIFA